jgi:hypothetical protein
MTANYRLLLTIACVLASICNLKAQEAAYDHKIIAILPFKTMSSKAIPPPGDSAVQRLLANETRLSVEIQEAFYNTVTSDKERLLVDVQDWKLTDSLLKVAGVDFRKVNFTDKQALATLLKVDAILVGEFASRPTPSVTVGPDVVTSVGFTAVDIADKKKRLLVVLYDGKTGDALWNFEKEIIRSTLFRSDKNLDAKLYKSFVKKFPYTR